MLITIESLKSKSITNTGLFEPCDNLLNHKFHVQNQDTIITNFQRGTGHIYVINDNDHEITIYRNQIMGKLSHIDNDVINTVNKNLTVHLKSAPKNDSKVSFKNLT